MGCTIAFVSLIDRILASPGDWTGARVVDELGLHMYDWGDRRRDPDVPSWLREVLVVCDFDTHLQMEGLLGWWENAAAEDLRLVTDALRSIGMENDAQLLEEAARVLAPSRLDADGPFEIGSVTSFDERHPAVTPYQYEQVHDIESGLYLNDTDGADLHALLVAHAASGLASAAR
jgi:hypothetical protein